MAQRNGISIYIDGSCSGNPGPGGWAAVCEIDGKVLAVRGFKTEHTTNNGMELAAAVGAVMAVTKPSDITLYTDSSYIITCAKHNDAWLTDPARANNETWMQLIKAVKKGGHTIKFVKVAGHSGIRLNEIADKLAKAECAKARHQLLK